MPSRRVGFGMEPFWRGEVAWGGAAPVVDVVEKDKEYEITAELPGLDEKNIEVKLSDDVLTIKGEKKEEKEEKQKDYYLSERRYGSFQRSFRLPDGVDAEKIEARFKNGVLTLSLPLFVPGGKMEAGLSLAALRVLTRNSAPERQIPISMGRRFSREAATRSTTAS